MARIMCIGHAVQDFVFGTPTLPAGGRKFRASSFESVGGGPAATAAVAIAKLGGEAVLAARVGDDSIGDVLINELENYGVDCALVRRFAGSTSSLSAVMIDADGERMIVNYRDPGMPADAAWLPAGMMTKADAALADSRWPEGAAVALALARAAHIPGVLDADVPMPDDPALLAAASHIAFSADGLRDLSARDRLEDGLMKVHRQYESWCCVTDGARGVLIADKGKTRAISAYAVNAVDTLGAGDVWHGAFALRLGEGALEIEAVNFANAASAVKVTRAGGRKGAPTRADVDAFMQANKSMEHSS